GVGNDGARPPCRPGGPLRLRDGAGPRRSRRGVDRDDVGALRCRLPDHGRQSMEGGLAEHRISDDRLSPSGERTLREGGSAAAGAVEAAAEPRVPAPVLLGRLRGVWRRALGSCAARRYPTAGYSLSVFPSRFWTRGW